MRRLHVPLLLGVAHGAADAAAGFLLGGLAATMPLEQVGLAVLMYNALAFGGQPLAGLLADSSGRVRGAALGGLALLCAALALGPGPVQFAVVLAGVGSALFHVGGGGLALRATDGRAAGPGLFAAPGVVGLALGGALAAGGVAAAPWLLGLLGLLAALVGLLPLPPHEACSTALPAPEHGFDTHDLIMLVLLAAIALRSAVWSSMHIALHGHTDVLIGMALAAAAGKIIGGLAADWLGWRRWTLGALALAAPLLALGGAEPLTLFLGVGLLQSASPAALAAAGRLLPNRPATAAGLTLGLAVAVGGLPQIGGIAELPGTPGVLPWLLGASALALWWALGRILKQQARTP